MQRNINNRSLFNNMDMYDRYQNDNTQDSKTKKETVIDFNEKTNENNETHEYETLSEVDILVKKYFYLISELDQIRGRLYSLGIDPNKIIN